MHQLGLIRAIRYALIFVAAVLIGAQLVSLVVDGKFASRASAEPVFAGVLPPLPMIGARAGVRFDPGPSPLDDAEARSVRAVFFDGAAPLPGMGSAAPEAVPGAQRHAASPPGGVTH